MTQFIMPIMVTKFSFEKSVLSHLDVLAGLDRGCSLTKIVYVDKEDSGSIDKDSSDKFIILSVASFLNADFDNAILWLKDRAHFTDNKEFPLHVTGVGFKYSEKIMTVLNRKVIFIEEILCQSLGAYNFLKNLPLEEITHPEMQSDYPESLDVHFTNNVKCQFQEIVGKRIDIKNSDDLLPCIFGFLGSGGGFAYIGKDGNFRGISALPMSGKTFLGLCRCILGTNSYKEMTDMAARGDRRRIDTQIKDITSDSFYRTMPQDIPIFHMGKLAETKKNVSEFNKDDIAHSLVSMFLYKAVNVAIHCCLCEKVGNVFFGGNLFQAEIFRKEFANIKKIFGFDFINFYFLNNGNTGALGAMMCFPSDTEKYYRA